MPDKRRLDFRPPRNWSTDFWSSCEIAGRPTRCLTLLSQRREIEMRMSHNRCGGTGTAGSRSSDFFVHFRYKPVAYKKSNPADDLDPTSSRRNLHVIESTFCCGFDSVRAHQLPCFQDHFGATYAFLVKLLFPSCSPKCAQLLAVSFGISEGSGRASFDPHKTG